VGSRPGRPITICIGAGLALQKTFSSCLTDLQASLTLQPPLTSALKQVGGQMLVRLSKMEQRYDAVLGVIKDGFTVTVVL
jgi:hypothetical protein